MVGSDEHLVGRVLEGPVPEREVGAGADTGDGHVERRLGSCAVALDLGDAPHAGVPLGEVPQIGEVGERLCW